MVKGGKWRETGTVVAVGLHGDASAGGALYDLVDFRGEAAAELVDAEVGV